MAHVEAETLEALNALLQDARASVEVEVALSNGATERAEREMLVSIGIEEVGLCCLLHEYLDASGALVTRHVNGIVLTIINTEQYDERLRAFALHQMDSGQRAHDLRGATDDPALGQLLDELYDAHLQSALWSERRASQFASSRSLEFQTSAEKHAGPRDAEEAPVTPTGGSRESTTSSLPSAPAQGKEAQDSLEGEEDWSEDSYRPSVTHETHPIDDE
jgi:hypothetical protein